MQSDTIETLLAKIIEEFHKTIPFDQSKEEIIKSVILEAPEEMSSITSNFKANGMDNIVTMENDFLLGTLISFIYYKFMLYCSLRGDPITEREIPLFQTCLFSNGSKLMELIIKVTGK